MTRKYFGTDGIRGTANSGVMTAEVALRVGMAAGLQFVRGDHRHRVVIGKDTRLSGYLLEPALTAGFISVGIDVVLVGPMPTPGVAMLTRRLRADLGVVISASHNAFQDNGIKLFGPDGYKLTDQTEIEIEANMDADLSARRTSSKQLGRAWRLDDAEGRYIEFAKNTFPRERTLEGLKVVIDCANGAAYKVAPTVLWELGAEVVKVAADPDGFNINRGCGSTSPDFLCEQVVTHGADIGIALDGDADRLVIADETGRLIDGDQLMALIARSWQKSGRLKGATVVATAMSNLGLERYLGDLGIRLIRTQVGDRYVVERMRADGFNLGGEQSGHIVMSDFNTTGDGLIAALQAMVAIADDGRPVSEAAWLFEPLPQLLRNVRYGDSKPLEDPAVQQAINDGGAQLGRAGRILIRESGTEPLIRVMAEGDDQALVNQVVDDIAKAVERAAASEHALTRTP
jgi:phosphoglucosamine mutase